MTARQRDYAYVGFWTAFAIVAGSGAVWCLVKAVAQ